MSIKWTSHLEMVHGDDPEAESGRAQANFDAMTRIRSRAPSLSHTHTHAHTCTQTRKLLCRKALVTQFDHLRRLLPMSTS